MTSMQEPTPPMPTVPPTVTIIGGIYNYQWEQESVQIILERLREVATRLRVTVVTDASVDVTGKQSSSNFA